MNEEIQREIKGPFDWNASENKIFVGCHFIIIYKKFISIKAHIKKKSLKSVTSLFILQHWEREQIKLRVSEQKEVID